MSKLIEKNIITILGSKKFLIRTNMYEQLYHNVGAQKNHLIERVLLSTHDIYFS